ncbi:hypothetical protein COP2_035574 [Malus domestica]
MVNKKSVMEVIRARAARPNFCNNDDKVVFAVHGPPSSSTAAHPLCKPVSPNLRPSEFSSISAHLHFFQAQASLHTRNLSDEIEKAAPEIRQVKSTLVRRIAEQIQLREETVEEFADTAPRPTRTPIQTRHFLPLCLRISRPGCQTGLDCSPIPQIAPVAAATPKAVAQKVFDKEVVLSTPCDFTAQPLTKEDEEVVKSVGAGTIPSYSLESKL